MTYPANERLAHADARFDVMDAEPAVPTRKPKSHRAAGGVSRFVLACYGIGILAVAFVVTAVLLSLSR
ncbi:hypothetical protein [Flindersiella endophytica]